MNRRAFNLAMVSGAFTVAGVIESAAAAAALTLNQQLEAIRKRHRLPALGAAVVAGDRTAAVQAVGVRKIGDPTRVTSGDRFHIGSCTKSMTATLIGILVDEGKLRWDLTLPEAFSELGAGIHSDLRGATLEQVLCHRAGLSGESWPEGKSFEDVHRLPGPPIEQRHEYARLILKQKPPRKPGKEFEYSNAGYAIAGAAAERATGTAWEELMRKRLFQPLGMSTAGFGAMGTPGKVDQPWQHTEVDRRWTPVPPGPLSDNPPAIGPGGTVHTSLGDWAKYAIAHLQGARGESRLLKPETWRKLHTPLPSGDYAFGWGLAEPDWGGGTVLTHNGSNTMNFAVIWLAPKKSFAVMATTNQGGEAAEQACDEVAAAMIARFL